MNGNKQNQRRPSVCRVQKRERGPHQDNAETFEWACPQRTARWGDRHTRSCPETAPCGPPSLRPHAAWEGAGHVAAGPAGHPSSLLQEAGARPLGASDRASEESRRASVLLPCLAHGVALEGGTLGTCPDYKQKGWSCRTMPGTAGREGPALAFPALRSCTIAVCRYACRQQSLEQGRDRPRGLRPSACSGLAGAPGQDSDLRPSRVRQAGAHPDAGLPPSTL